MPLSTPGLKFLLDENVKKKLLKFLDSKGFDVKLSPKSTKDSEVAKISKQENRILVTNDSDFQWYDKKQIHSVILLSIPQNDPRSLISSFEKLIKKCKNFAGKLITLLPNDWNESSLY